MPKNPSAAQSEDTPASPLPELVSGPPGPPHVFWEPQTETVQAELRAGRIVMSAAMELEMATMMARFRMDCARKLLALGHEGKCASEDSHLSDGVIDSRV